MRHSYITHVLLASSGAMRRICHLNLSLNPKPCPRSSCCASPPPSLPAPLAHALFIQGQLPPNQRLQDLEEKLSELETETRERLEETRPREDSGAMGGETIFPG